MVSLIDEALETSEHLLSYVLYRQWKNGWIYFTLTHNKPLSISSLFYIGFNPNPKFQSGKPERTYYSRPLLSADLQSN